MLGEWCAEGYDWVLCFCIPWQFLFSPGVLQSTAYMSARCSTDCWRIVCLLRPRNKFHVQSVSFLGYIRRRGTGPDGPSDCCSGFSSGWDQESPSAVSWIRQLLQTFYLWLQSGGSPLDRPNFNCETVCLKSLNERFTSAPILSQPDPSCVWLASRSVC